jgi:hypothetical protein
MDKYNARKAWCLLCYLVAAAAAAVVSQDQMVLEMRDMIKALQDDCRSLAGAITQLTSPGADVGAVLQALPPTLVQVRALCAVCMCTQVDVRHKYVVWTSCQLLNCSNQTNSQ